MIAIELDTPAVHIHTDTDSNTQILHSITFIWLKLFAQSCIIHRAIKIYMTFENVLRMIWFNGSEQIWPSGIAFGE